MINNLLKSILIIFFFLFMVEAYSQDQFNFDITEIQIKENGNKFIGKKRGTITSKEGIIIKANEFEYDKKLNILKARGKVKIKDTLNDYIIFTDKIIYKKNDGKIFTEKNSKAKNLNDNIEISADNFEYNIIKNIIIAEKNVILENKIEDYLIYSEFLSYLRNEEQIFTKGKTTALIDKKYNIKTQNLTFYRNSMELVSKNKTELNDKQNIYNLSKFNYLIDKEILRGEKILINTNYKLAESDKFYFSSAIIDLKNKNFVAKDTQITMHKKIFDNSDNDPRIKGVSSKKEGDITIVNKAVFTSCKKNDDCPPWAIQSNEIKHDKKKKQLIYKNALLKVYDIPVLYFPKFFHPDPTVERQSGILKPVLNNSNVLGSSFSLPYYSVISDDSDITFAPTLFDNKTKMLQNEYRKVGKNFSFLTNFGHAREYKSSLQNKNKNISYFFSKLNLDLDLEKFDHSNLNIRIEKVTNDTFLKVFDTNLLDVTTSLNPTNPNNLTSEFKISLNNENNNFIAGFQSFENLQLANNDRYQYVLPYYNFDKIIFPELKTGTISFNSSGSNDLNNTNELKSQIINNIIYSSNDYISSKGLKSNFDLNFKNLNSVGKNVTEYKSSPQVELSSILNLKSSYPMNKIEGNYKNLLTPKASLRINPSDMKNYNNSKRTINTNNIFSVNRLGLNDTFETGKSLTLGLDYRKETLSDMNKYFEMKLATVIRNKKENFIPSSTTLNKSNSNIFGSITNNFSNNLKLNYEFALNEDLNELQYNDVNATMSVNNFVTKFNFIKETGDMGNQNLIENSTTYIVDEKNHFSFNTRRNRKLNLTEFYDLVYEYKNDCFVAAIKYKKTYYEDRDLKPTEDLFFTVTLFPLTTFEQKVDQSLY